MMFLEKLCLGTVQFGLKYGINNKVGKPSESEVFQIMDYAYNRGIRTFDTARAYGDSEEVLGRYLDQANIKRSELTIISKFMPKTLRVEQNLNQLNIKEHLEQSLVRLNLDYLDGYLLHTPEEFYEKEMMNDLMKLKEEGLVRKIGVSIYEMNHALDVVKSGIIDAIQVPYNILDQRVDDSEFFEIAKRNSVTVFARSPFLQGLLTMAADEIPKHLSEVKIYINQLNDLSKKYDISIIDMCMLFSTTNTSIDFVVFGVDSVDQLKENIDALYYEHQFDECREEIEKIFAQIERSIIFPSLWAKKS
ncbi:MAG: aldo/keto reductase [Firmicutes bacterium HGW-Firmicutes-7]|nr:MAG: aldo/keto reductase [Firmicutes bacterium HGW-Firmicutes-7]